MPVTVLWEGSLGAQCTWDGAEQGTRLLLGHVPGRRFQGSTAPSGSAPPPCRRVSCIRWRRARGPRQHWGSLRGSLVSCVQVQGHTPHVAPHPGHAVFAQAPGPPAMLVGFGVGCCPQRWSGAGKRRHGRDRDSRSPRPWSAVPDPRRAHRRRCRGQLLQGMCRFVSLLMNRWRGEAAPMSLARPHR